jgi:hypothetical protein
VTTTTTTTNSTPQDSVEQHERHQRFCWPLFVAVKLNGRSSLNGRPSLSAFAIFIHTEGNRNKTPFTNLDPEFASCTSSVYLNLSLNLHPQSILIAAIEKHLIMAARPQNIGIKAIELYFPSQVSMHILLPLRNMRIASLKNPVLIVHPVCRPARTREV